MVRGALVKGYSFLLTILICVALVPIWSQTNGGPDRLKSLYTGEVLLLREEVTRRSWTLAGFEITDIEPTAKGVEIVGDRKTVILQPLGIGLDEQAIRAVSKWKMSIRKTLSVTTSSSTKK
jgi:hypothetical protein